MKRSFLTLLLCIATTLSAWSMNYEEARSRAWFLTDKMAYELNLTPEQFDRAYEVNLNYFMSMRSANDCYGHYWNYRNDDFRYILFDWQYSLYSALDYFFRPVRWVRSAWYYPVCEHYRYGYYYYNRPQVYLSYHGGYYSRRGHNDVSPYRYMTFSRSTGMRDRYHATSQLRPGNNGRPGGQRPEGNFRPNAGNNKPQSTNAGNRYYNVDPSFSRGHSSSSSSRGDNNSSSASRPSRSDNNSSSTSRPSRGNYNSSSSFNSSRSNSSSSRSADRSNARGHNR